MNLQPENMPRDTWLKQLQELAKRDMPAARRMALLNILWQESYLIPAGLISRVTDLLGWGCFGRSPRPAFARDIAAVRKTLTEKGHKLRYSRKPSQRGYFVAGRPPLDERLRQLIEGSAAEVDVRQMKITIGLTHAQRFRQGCSMVELVEQVGAYRLRLRQPHFSEAEARRVLREGKSWYD